MIGMLRQGRRPLNPAKPIGGAGRHRGPALLISALALFVFSSSCALSAVRKDLETLAGAITGSAPSGPVQIFVSSPQPIPDTIITAAKGLPGVLAAGNRASGLADLRAVHGSDRPLAPRPADAILPVSFISIDPGFLDAIRGLGTVSAALRKGEAVLPKSSAEFRGLAVGDAVELAGAGGNLRLNVGAVVPDESTFRAELILPEAQAAPISGASNRSLLLAVEPTAVATAEADLRKLAGTFPVRIRTGSSSRGSRRLLSLFEIKQTFGEFWYRPLGRGRLALDPAWTGANLVQTQVPLLGQVRCHKAIIPQLSGAMAELEASGAAPLIRSYDGCFSPRMQIPNDEALSRHAFGIAVDINAATNKYGAPPTMDPKIVETMERWGFSWGGRWSVPDGMHFEFVRFPKT
jgi:hypothetical protein